MKPDNLFNANDRAVSPVIGVILMVAITVILAAVIGTFVLGLGDSLGDSQPSAQLSVDVDNSTNNVTISHNGGDPIDSANLEVIAYNGTTSVDRKTIDAGQFTVGDSVSVGYSTGGSSDVDEIRVIHTPSESFILRSPVSPVVSGFDTWN